MPKEGFGLVQRSTSARCGPRPHPARLSRTTGQAAALDALLAKAGRCAAGAVSPQVEAKAIIARLYDRLSGRHTCDGCGEGCHDDCKQPAQAGACCECGGTDGKRRADDNADTVRERLTACRARKAPLIAHHERRSVLERMPVMGSITCVRATLAGMVGRVSA